MGLNQRGRGHGRGGKGSFANKGRRGGGGGGGGGIGMGNQGPIFRPCPPPPGMFGPPMGYPPEPPFRAPFFGGPPALNFGPPRPGYGKFPRKNFKKKPVQKNNDTPILEIDLSKPWVTEEIKNEEAKKKECLEVWRKSKNDEDWSKYKAQKQVVQNLYDKAKDEYIANHPEQAYLLRNSTTTVKYYCDTCDKSFKTDDDMYLHEAEHEVCGREGCEFSAHPKIIAKHKRMQHDSGLYKRIGKLYTEEDIKKWIEERKRRYPSRKVVEEKKALEQEKLKRGERIKDNQSKFNKEFRKNRKSNRSKRGESKTSKNRRSKRKGKTHEVNIDSEEESQTDRSGIPAFRGIKNASESEKAIKEEDKNENEGRVDDINISDDEWEVSNQAPKVRQPLINSSLRLLAACYDSNSDEDEGIVLDEMKTEVAKDAADEDSGPEEVKTVHIRSSTTSDENLNNNDVSRKRKSDNKSETQIENKKRPREQNLQNKLRYKKVTLLEKLLKTEIRHERNVILQCVNYIVKNNFLQKTC